MNKFSIFFEANSKVDVDQLGGIHLPDAIIRDIMSRSAPVNRTFEEIVRIAELVDLVPPEGGGGGGGGNDGGIPPPRIDPLLDTMATKVRKPKSDSNEPSEGEGEPGEGEPSEGEPGDPGDPGKPNKPGEPSKPGKPGDPSKPGEQKDSEEGTSGEGESGEPGEPGESKPSTAANGEPSADAEYGNTVTVTPNPDGTFTDQDGNVWTADQIRSAVQSGTQVKGISKIPQSSGERVSETGTMITKEEQQRKQGIQPGEAEHAEGSTPETNKGESVDDIKRGLRNTKIPKHDSEALKKKMEEQAEKAREQIVEDPDATDDFWKQRARESADISTASGSGGGGSSKEKLTDKIIQRLKANINWKDALKRLFTKPGDKYEDWRHPSRRTYGTRAYMPIQREDENEIDDFAVAIDQSGSLMAGEAFSKFMSEVINLFKTIDNARGVVLVYDDRVTDAVEITPQNYNKLLNVRPSGGGNDMDSVPAYIQRHLKNFKPKAVIFFTDGYEERPNLPKKINGEMVEYIFFLVPGGRRDTVEGFGSIYPIVM